ncbi:hypothetical protein B0H10DRAFT_1944280 [Mycena sp. CBHHK59/15]|nr:hypothetical protein B0H10DRAFT_1944280 [Mycena sp. CBHHK59/15]
MFSAKVILTALAFVAVSSARLPRRPDPPSPPSGCVIIPVVSDTCINFTGGLSFLNKEVSNVQVPGGFVCTFFEDFGCLNGGVNGHDVAVLTGGTWDMFRVQGISGTQNFNDLTSSISCSPV